MDTSAAHIYHSALPLSPRTSIVRRFYERYAHPLMRIVQGVPMSWDPVVAAMKCSYNLEIRYAVWSPCSRFIAIEVHESLSMREIQILDAVTLKQIRSLEPQEPPDHYAQSIIFSAESRSLAHLSSDLEASISWDLQTGVPAGIISSEEWERRQHLPEDSSYVEGMEKALSITYSGCGTMYGILFEHYDDRDNYNDNSAVIITYNVLFRASVGTYPVKRPAAHMIWTHGECIQFAAFGSGSITIWEVGFVSEHPATEVESMSTPGNFHPSSRFLFLPPLSRLAFVLKNSIFVWDIKHSKPLLSCVDIEEPMEMTFSDGSFFACATRGFEIYLWKDSPTGYVLHHKLMSSATWSTPLLSPDGRSILAFRGSTLQLWRTSDSIIPLSTTPAQVLQSTNPFALEFSPDESSVAVARLLDNTATVLDLRSGVPRLTIDAGMRIYGLRAGGSTVAVVGKGKVVTWNLPQRDHAPNATVNIFDSIRSTILDYSPSPTSFPPPSASISPDFNHIAIAGEAVGGDFDMTELGMTILDMATGKCLGGIKKTVYRLWWAPNEHEGWCRNIFGIQEWGIVKNYESGFLKMVSLGLLQDQSKVNPWVSSRGYEIMDDGWILNSNEKRLFWLPPHWRRGEMNRMWSGRFLALLHSGLPEAVILEVLQK